MRGLDVGGMVMALAGTLVALPAAAQTQPSAADYVCKLTPEDCTDGTAPAELKQREGERSFSLALNTAPKPRTAPPARPALAPVAPARTYAAPAARTAPAPGARAQALGVSRGDMMMTFLNGSAELTPQARANAAVLAKVMNSGSAASKRFLIEGHTNAVGTPEKNRLLSEQRANALVDFLVTNGVDRSRLEAKGYGFDRPLAGRPAAAPENRRVEAKAI